MIYEAAKLKAEDANRPAEVAADSAAVPFSPALVASDVARVVPLVAADKATAPAAPALVASEVAKVVPEVAAERATAPAAPALVASEVATAVPLFAVEVAELATNPAESAAEIAVAASSVGKVAAAYQLPTASVRQITEADVEASVVLNAAAASTIVTVFPDESLSLTLTVTS